MTCAVFLFFKTVTRKRVLATLVGQANPSSLLYTMYWVEKGAQHVGLQSAACLSHIASSRQFWARDIFFNDLLSDFKSFIFSCLECLRVQLTKWGVSTCPIVLLPPVFSSRVLQTWARPSHPGTRNLGFWALQMAKTQLLTKLTSPLISLANRWVPLSTSLGFSSVLTLAPMLHSLSSGPGVFSS